MLTSTLNSLKTNKFIITPNRRLASFLTKRLAEHLEPGAVSHTRISSWQDLLQYCRLIQPFTFDQGLLSVWQSRFLWQGVIRSSPYVDGMINIAETQELAASAVDLCQQWLISPKSFIGIKEESDALIQWWEHYSTRCQTLQMMDESALSAALLSAAQRGDLQLGSIAFYGFDEFTPLQAAFIAALGQQGTQINIESGHTFASTPQLFKAKHAEEEWLSAILQAKALLEKNHHPALPIGIVIPNIQQSWHALSELLTQVFHPQAYVPGAPAVELPYNISSGMALYEYPAVGCVMMILELQTAKQISAHTLSYLLGSPDIKGGMDEQSSRAIFDKRCRTKQCMHHEIDSLVADPHIPDIFRTCLSTPFDISGTARFSIWADRIMELLTAWGWPGDRRLSSISYQAVEHFYEVLTELRTLDAVSESVTFETALHQLSSQLKRTLFQPQTEDKPIQVLGLLEAAGLSFSHLWVCGMDDSLPGAPNPHPLIPISWQRNLAMPHASSERESSYTQKIIDRLASSAEHVIFSYAAFSEEGYTKHPSYIVAALQAQQAAPLPAPVSPPATPSISFLENMPEEEPIPYTEDQIAGGSALLKAQIACPFSAFARFRWNAQSLESPTLGLSMKSRGQLLHEIMQTLMLQIQDSERLAALHENEEKALIEACIQGVLQKLSPPLMPSLRDLEFERLLLIVQESLNHERERGAFTVKGVEVPIEVNLADLSFRLRIDRWDETPEGALLIDYKTGRVHPDNWDSLDDPQLPLYAAALDKIPAGLAYAVLRKEEVGLKGQGIIKTPGMEQIPEEAWAQKINDWHEALVKTADDFKKGLANLAPKYGPHTCKRCDLHTCCRIAEITAPLNTEGDHD